MNWFNKSVEEVSKTLNTDLEKGLSEDEAKKRQKENGYNELQEKKKKSTFAKFLEQFKDFMIIVLIIAAIISGVVGQMQGEGFTDSIIILIVVILNAVIGVIQENKAEKSLEALKKMSSYSAKVMRDGKVTVVPSRELVPGDIVVLDTGDYVPADIRIIDAVNLKAQEASLTGESVPVEKDAATIENEEVSLGDRTNMLFSSSLVTYGRGKGIVVETGMHTEVGNIAGMLNSVEETATPLQQKLNKLGKSLGIMAIVICIVIFIIGLAYGKDVIDMFMTAVSLAVAAIPEGLAAVSTIVLAIGVQRMVKKNAIVKKLPAVETLGSASVICSDKTGTLTQNKMEVQKIFVNGQLIDVANANLQIMSEKSKGSSNSTNEEVKDMLSSDELEKTILIGMLCNDTKIALGNSTTNEVDSAKADNSNDSTSNSEESNLKNVTFTGDPTEIALTQLAFNFKYDENEINNHPRVAEIPFDSDRKLMTTVNKFGDRYLVCTKGGLDELLSICNSYSENGEIKTDLKDKIPEIEKQNESLAKNALRVLAMAYKYMDHAPVGDEILDLERNLTFVGMCGMIDPPREEAKIAVQKCKEAGIKTVMITGDHKITATAIARGLGILENEDEAITGAELAKMSDEELDKNIRKYSVYARVAPEHKVRIVKAWQKAGEIVAMTGDGVNDAPALKQADIGCAMGMVGTDVAKEAADVILTDDNFATIVSAVEEGRRIYANILKAIEFLISSNIGEIVLLFVCMLITPFLSSTFGIDINLIEPLLPMHILWINLVTDSLPALALAVDPAEDDIMKKKPNKEKGIFVKSRLWRVAYQGVMIGLITLAAFIIGLATPDSILPQIEGLSNEEVKVEIGQTMAFVTLAFAELVHVFNVRNPKKSIFKTHPFKNKMLLLALGVSSMLMIVILAIPGLREVFSIPVLPVQDIIEMILLILSPIVIVEIMKLIKLNGNRKQEE